MAVNLPPFPANSPPGSWAWTDWWKKLQNYIADVTKVAQTGTTNPDPLTQIVGFTGLTDTVSIKWAAVANYCEFYIHINIDPSINLVTQSAYINASGNPPLDIGLPPLVGEGGTVTIAVWDANGVPPIPGPPVPYIQSLGVGTVNNYSGETTIFLPDFTAFAGGSKKLTITGRYNTQ